MRELRQSVNQYDVNRTKASLPGGFRECIGIFKMAGDGHDITNTCFTFSLPYAHIFPTHMVRNSVQAKLRMRKQNTIRAVPLDAVPERRIERCSPRFRPGDRFCELSLRYLSPGREGEKCRPLDHM